MSLHITIDPKALPLPDQETLSCLRNFIDQLSLFRSDHYFDRMRYVVFNDLQVTMSPVKGPLSRITFRAACKAIAGLWYYMSRSKLLFELKFAVFDNGRMVAWGMLEFRDGPPSPPTPPSPGPLPTAVE